MNIEQTFGVCVLLTGIAFGLAVIYREYTSDIGLWKLARVLGLLGFICWLCFGYHAVKECETALEAAAHWEQLAAVKSNGVGTVASHYEVRTPNGSVVQWDRTNAGSSRPMFRATERIGCSDSGVRCGCAAGTAEDSSPDCLRGSQQSGTNGVEWQRL